MRRCFNKEDRRSREPSQKDEAENGGRSQLQMLAQALFRAQEDERRRLSRDLHDNLGQKLTALAIKARLIEKELDESPSKARIDLSKFQDQLTALVEEIRDTAHLLHPSSIEHLGLESALQSLCAEVSSQSGIAVKVFRKGPIPAIAPALAVSLYRLVQEALQNVVKHSGASSASVRLSAHTGFLSLVIRDRGTGFHRHPKQSQGLGIISMEERVRLAGGTFDLRTESGRGVQISVKIPLTRSRAGKELRAAPDVRFRTQHRNTKRHTRRAAARFSRR